MYDARMTDPIEEDQCVICQRWPATLRPIMRDAVFTIPLKQPVCDGCLMAFWINVYGACEERRRLAHIAALARTFRRK